jgi:hypothetical protein
MYWTSWRISDGVGSSMRRLPHWSVTRFQYEPYARRQPSLTRADTTGMYSAKVGAGGLAAGGGQQVGGGQAHPLQHEHGRVDHGLPGCG